MVLYDGLQPVLVLWECGWDYLTDNQGFECVHYCYYNSCMVCDRDQLCGQLYRTW